MKCAVRALCGLIHSASETGPHFFTTMRTAQIRWNLTFSILIWATTLCGPKTDKSQISGNLNSVRTIIPEDMQLLRL